MSNKSMHVRVLSYLGQKQLMVFFSLKMRGCKIGRLFYHCWLMAKALTRRGPWNLTTWKCHCVSIKIRSIDFVGICRAAPSHSIICPLPIACHNLAHDLVDKWLNMLKCKEVQGRAQCTQVYCAPFPFSKQYFAPFQWYKVPFLLLKSAIIVHVLNKMFSFSY